MVPCTIPYSIDYNIISINDFINNHKYFMKK